METSELKFSSSCPRDDIAAYLDCELASAEEFEIERHFGECEICRRELNLQKQFLCALNSGLENEDEIALPENFAKVIATTAETRVNGLRKPSERYNAAFVCSGLFIIIMLTVGADSGNFLASFLNGVEKAVAIGSFAAHTAYDLAIGAVIILRSLSSQLSVNSPFSLTAAAFLGIYLYLISHIAAFFNRG
jgi:predicted anti-sigma-YlaC factor YlaD